MAELQQVFNDISANPGLVRHFVMASSVQGVFNFGGDLSLFVLLVRARDLESLRLYARRCIDLVWWWENAAQLGVHTTALVQGDTLGGGLESALLHHTVIFEKSAQAGFPEVLFNLFPGMGGWNLSIRKGSYTVANDMNFPDKSIRQISCIAAGWSNSSSKMEKENKRWITSYERWSQDFEALWRPCELGV
jgi:DSF synthase